MFSRFERDLSTPGGVDYKIAGIKWSDQSNFKIACSMEHCKYIYVFNYECHLIGVVIYTNDNKENEYVNFITAVGEIDDYDMLIRLITGLEEGESTYIRDKNGMYYRFINNRIAISRDNVVFKNFYSVYEFGNSSYANSIDLNVVDYFTSHNVLRQKQEEIEAIQRENYEKKREEEQERQVKENIKYEKKAAASKRAADVRKRSQDIHSMLRNSFALEPSDAKDIDASNRFIKTIENINKNVSYIEIFTLFGAEFFYVITESKETFYFNLTKYQSGTNRYRIFEVYHTECYTPKDVAIVDIEKFKSSEILMNPPRSYNYDTFADFAHETMTAAEDNDDEDDRFVKAGYVQGSKIFDIEEFKKFNPYELIKQKAMDEFIAAVKLHENEDISEKQYEIGQLVRFRIFFDYTREVTKYYTRKGYTFTHVRKYFYDYTKSKIIGVVDDWHILCRGNTPMTEDKRRMVVMRCAYNVEYNAFCSYHCHPEQTYSFKVSDSPGYYYNTLSKNYSDNSEFSAYYKMVLDVNVGFFIPCIKEVGKYKALSEKYKTLAFELTDAIFSRGEGHYDYERHGMG